ncbi:cell division protein SepF [Thermophilibacter sp.]
MSFLDSIKDRLRGGSDDGYYDDDYYEDESYEDDGYQRDRDSRRRDTGSSGHLLGTTPRPEAESVSVYTRSGRPVAAQQPPARSYADPTPVAAPEPPRQASSYAYEQPTQVTAPVSASPQRVSSGQLPPYVLKPVSYDDVQTVVRRVRTNQPVVVSFRNTNIECAKRILDFCFGFSYGVDGEVRELGDRVFCVLPAGVDLSQADIDKLVADGELTR